MLSNIYIYSKQFPFDKAIFICGAEHRKHLMQKIKDIEVQSDIKLNWSFYKTDH
jgi:hypothetical protein